MIPPHTARQNLLLMALGLLVLVSLMLAGAPGFYPAYLAGYLFWLGLSLGPLGLHMISRVTGGHWGEQTRAPFLAASGVLPVLAVLFLPLVIGMPALYAWYPDAGAQGGRLADKAIYLNSAFFLLRALVYFGIWLTLATVLVRDARVGRTVAGRRLSAPGLILFALSGTFAVIDWVMSLLPVWYSTVFAAEVLIAQLLQGVCLGVLVQGPVSERGRPERSKQDWLDLGNLMLLFTLLWAYLAFSDYLTIWIADLPDETLWYRLRLAGSGWWTGTSLMLLMFAIPFLALLFRALKQHQRTLQGIALIVLAGTLLNAYWLTVPSLQQAGHISWQLLIVPLAMGAVWTGFFRLRLLQQAVLTNNGVKHG